MIVKLQECGHSGLRRVEAVYAFFDGVVIIVNAKHETWVGNLFFFFLCLLLDLK